MTLEIDVTDSTELHYDILQSNEDIPDDFVESQVSSAVAQTLMSIYNNREEVIEQLEAQEEGGATPQTKQAIEAE